MTQDITATPEWAALQAHYEATKGAHLRELFAADPNRGTEMVAEVGDLYVDFSKNRVTAETICLLVDLARAAGLEEKRDAMFRGEHINNTEDRAVLHTALRAPRDAVLVVDGQAADFDAAFDRAAVRLLTDAATRARLTAASLEICDGLGAERVAQAFLEVIGAPGEPV